MTKLRALLLLLGLTALVVTGASLVHLHQSGEVGLWNEEHDLGLMATLSAAASLLEATPVVILVLALLLPLAPASVRIAGLQLEHADPRAPPAR